VIEFRLLDVTATTASKILSSKNLGDDSRDCKTIVDRALKEMGAMRRPKWFGPQHAAQQRQCGIRQIIEREQQCRDQLLLPL
jgi:hypothetical protein